VTTARLELSAVDKTRRAFDSANKNLSGLDKAASAISKRMVAVGAAAGLVVASAGAAFANLTRQSFATIDSLGKTADKIGLTTEALAGLRHAGELTGVAQNTLDQALQRVTRRVAEAAKGTGEAKGALQELGIDAKKLVNLPLDVQMGIIADQMNLVENQADRVRLSMKLFDSEGVALVNTLKLGSSGLANAAIEAEGFRLAVSRIDAQKIEDANDAISRLGAAIKGLANSVAVSIAPIVEELAGGFSKAIKTIAKNYAAFTQRVRSDLAAIKRLFGDDVKERLSIAEQLKVENNLLEEQRSELSKNLSLIGSNEVTLLKKETLKEENSLLRLQIEATEEMIERLKEQQKVEAGTISQRQANINSGGANFEGLASTLPEKSNPAGIVGGSDDGSEPIDASQFGAAASEFAKQRQLEQVEFLKQSYATENELLREKNQTNLEIIQEFRNQELITEQEHNELKLQENNAYFENLKELAKTNYKALGQLANTGLKGQLQATKIVGGQILQAGAQQSEKLFKINKAASLAGAIVSTAQGIANALADVPYPGNLFAAASVAAAGFAQIQAIRAQQYKGGGSAPPTPSGGAPASGQAGGGIAASPPLTQSENQNLNLTIITRGRDGREEAIEIVKNIRELQEEGEPIFAGAN
jgi:hypothetical protein